MAEAAALDATGKIRCDDDKLVKYIDLAKKVSYTIQNQTLIPKNTVI